MKSALREYENGMWIRMEQEKVAAAGSQSVLFADDSPAPTIKLIESGVRV